MLSKAIVILEAIASTEKGIGVREFARETNMDKSTVSRLLLRLKGLDLVDRSELTGRFVVGERLRSIAAAVHATSTLWGLAEPIITQLCGMFDETCYLVTRQAAAARFQHRVECRQPVRYVIETGRESPLYAGASGRAVLSGMTEEEVRDYLDSVDLVPLTKETIVSRALIMERWTEDRRHGFVVSEGETVPDGRGIGAPVFRADGHCVGAVILTLPASRFDRTRAIRIAHGVARAAEAVSRRLGWKPVVK